MVRIHHPTMMMLGDHFVTVIADFGKTLPEKEGSDRIGSFMDLVGQCCETARHALVMFGKGKATKQQYARHRYDGL